MLDGCRLNDLECCPQQELSKPFLLEKFWLWEDDERDGDVIEADMQNKVYRGNIELINLGCGNSYNLYVKASHRLNVQTLCNFPCFCPYGLKQGKLFLHVPSGKEESAGAGGLPFPYAQAHVHQQPPVQRGRSQGAPL